MDVEIPAAVKRRKKIKRIGIAAGAIILLGGAAWFGVGTLASRVSIDSIRMAKAEIGMVESSVVASGKVVPAYEEIIVTPVATRILEVYVTEGDSVSRDTPLLRLDLESAETNYRQLADELEIKQSEINQSAINSQTALSDLEMRISAKEMAVDQLHTDYLNERRLDSIGSGTGERVRQAELAWKTGNLELRQMRRQLENERRIAKASAHKMNVEDKISRRNLAQAASTLDNARILSPRSGTVTWINSSLGSTLGAGEKVAMIADLSHFKVSGELPEGHVDKLAVGGLVRVKVGDTIYDGKVININPKSNSGMISFVAMLDNDNAPELRAGRSATISIVYDEHPKAIRIPNGPYYKGAGTYTLFIREGDRLVRRQVRLGESNPQWVEVREGIKPGEEAAVSDMTSYEQKSSLSIK